MSSVFIQTVEKRQHGRNMVFKRGRGRLRAANPSDSEVPPMAVLGTFVLILVFPSTDETLGVRVRMMEGPPVGPIIDTTSMRP